MKFTSDFWKFWADQTISTLGGSFTSFALPLVIYKLTGSPLNLAFTVVVSVLPYLFLGLVIGAWADRVNRKQLMIFTDIARALVIASLPLTFALGFLSVWWIYAAGFINSTLSICFDAANFAAIPSLVEANDLMTANGRLQAGYSTAKIIGPALAGLLLLLVPLPLLLLVDAASFLISAGSLVMIKASFNSISGEKKEATSLRQEVSEGLRYVLGQPVLRALTFLLLLINFFHPTTDVQLVLFAKQWLGASDTQLGFLYASGSIGIVVFSLAANRLQKRWPVGPFLLTALLVGGIFTATPAFTHQFWTVLPLWAMRAAGGSIFNITTYSLTQTIVPNALLGRVITTVRVLTWSTASIGALLGGLAIVWTKNVGLVYGVIGLIISLIACTFFMTPLGQAEQYLSGENSPVKSQKKMVS